MSSISLATARSRLRIYLNDTDSKVWSSDDELDLFINHALIKFTSDVPLATAATFTIADDQLESGGRTYSLPGDVVSLTFIRGYFETTSVEENIFPLQIGPGAWDENDEPRGILADWPVYGQFYLPRAPQGSTFKLYYLAFHNSWLTEETDSYNPQRRAWAEQAWLSYAAYLAFNPSSSRRAQLEQWNRKGDANVGNPLEEEARRWLALYVGLLAEHVEQPTSIEFVTQRRA